MPTVNCLASADASTYSGSTSYNENGNTLYVGLNSSFFVWRTFINFDMSGIPANAIISSAVFNIRNSFNGGSADLWIDRVTSSWSETGVTWASSPSVTTGERATMTIPGNPGATWFATNITSLAQAWGSSSRYGLRLMSSVEATLVDNHTYYSRTDGNGTPYVAVTYNTPPNPPGAFTSPLAGQTFRDTINIQWGAATDPDGQSVEYYMQYYNGSSWVALNGPGSLGRHTTNSYTWDVSGLPQHSNYQVRVYSTDLNGGESGWVTSGTFAINRQTHQMMM